MVVSNRHKAVLEIARSQLIHCWIICVISCLTSIRKLFHVTQGRNQLFISGGPIFIKFHSMTSLCLFNRGTTVSQTVTYNYVFLRADMKSIVYKHTYSAQRWLMKTTFYNSVEGWITSVKRNFWLHAPCACTEQHSTYKIRWENWWLGLRIWCLGKCVGLGFMLQLEKEK